MAIIPFFDPPNADNLFKFLFLNGVIMVAIGLFYPLQKSDELQLRILEYNKKIELLQQDIIELRDDSKSLNSIVDSRIKLAKSLVLKRKDLTSQPLINDINSQIQDLKLKTNLAYHEIKKNESEIAIGTVNLKNEKKVIKQLKKQVSIYNSYCNWLLGVGIFLGIIGFTGWVTTTIFSEYPNYKDFNERWRKAQRISRRRNVIRRLRNRTPPPSVISASNPSTP